MYFIQNLSNGRNEKRRMSIRPQCTHKDIFMKSYTVYLYIIVFCAFVCSSCVVVQELIFFNNSGFDVKLQLEDGSEKYYNVKFNGTIENGYSVKFQYPVHQRVLIQTEATNWVYSFTNFPPRKNGHVRKEIRVQLEATGDIYLLLPTEEFPFKYFTTQPIGYPLRPDVEQE